MPYINRIRRRGGANQDRRGFQYRLLILGVGSTVVVGFAAWLAWSEPTAHRWLVRLYTDRRFMRDVLDRWGVFAPLVFIGIQMLQVVIAPIPGDVTGVLGGFAFGQWRLFTRRSASRSAPSWPSGSADASALPS